MANSRRQSERGSLLIEFTLVLPLLILVILGTVDAGLLMYDWSAANKATYRGARVAVVNNPVSSAVQFPIANYSNLLTRAGNYCFKQDGTPDSTSACPSVSVTCKGGAGTAGSCTSGTFSDAAFTKIFDAVQLMYPFKLSRAQVQVKYETTGLGFVGQPSFNDPTKGELPMNVTVSLRCIKHEFYFVGGIIGWAFPSLGAGCDDVTSDPAAIKTRGLTMPDFYSTLPSESLYTIP